VLVFVVSVFVVSVFVVLVFVVPVFVVPVGLPRIPPISVLIATANACPCG
jgi:hypothetical protein